MSDTIRTQASIDVGTADAKVGGGRRAFLIDHGIPMTIGLLAVGAITIVMMVFSRFFVSEHLIFLYLLPVTGIAMFYSSTPALVTSIISILGVEYFLFPPVFSLRIDDKLQSIELLMFGLLAFIASKASSQLLR